MDANHRSNLIKALNDEAERTKTPEESIKKLISIGILASNGDLIPNYYPYPEGCLQVWRLKEIKS